MAPIAPQSEWPQTTMSPTPSTATAYSTEALTRRAAAVAGTMLPALRITKSSPGSRWVSSSGTTRLSEQAMNSALGLAGWPGT